MNFTDFLNTITATAGNVAQIVRPPTAPTAPTAPAAPGSMPKWLLPVGIGAVALVVVLSLVKR